MIFSNKLHFIPAIALCVMAATSHASELVPVGPEYRISADDAEVVGSIRPEIIGLKNGNYLVVWVDDKDGRENMQIHAQRYDASGTKQGALITIVVGKALDRVFAAELSDNSLLFTWYSLAGGVKAYARRFLSSGQADGEKWLINPPSQTVAVWPSIGVFNTGGYIITWVNATVAPSADETYARVYQNDGTPQGEHFLVSQNIKGTHTPYAHVLENGSYVISWSAEGVIYKRLFSQANTPEPIVQVGEGYNPQIIQQEGGNYLLIWSSDSTDLGGHSVAQMFSVDGTPVGEKHILLDHIDSVDVSSMPEGGFIIVGTRTDAVSGTQHLYGQKFNADLTKSGDIMQIDSLETGKYVKGAVLGGEYGGFITAWGATSVVNNDNKSHIYARHYSNGATPIAPQMTLSALPESLYVGESVTFDVNVSGQNLYGLDGVLTSNNPTAVQLTDAQYGEFFPDGERLGMPSSITDTQWQGALSLMAPAEPKSGAGKFASVILKALAAGEVTLSLSSQITDPNGVLLLDDNTSYSITVKEALKLTGRLAEFGVGTDYTSVRIYINGELADVAPDGSFEFNALPGEVIVRIEADGFLPAEKRLQLTDADLTTELGNTTMVAGDSNEDETINIGDLTKLLAAYRSSKAQGAPYTPLTDFNRDDVINIQDLTILGRNYGKSGIQSW